MYFKEWDTEKSEKGNAMNMKIKVSEQEKEKEWENRNKEQMTRNGNIKKRNEEIK